MTNYIKNFSKDVEYAGIRDVYEDVEIYAIQLILTMTTYGKKMIKL